ncbi:mitochondrial 54S ribosomal protein YmL9 [Boeremia exigua]|uniref:mitochondrial 54S ribosomal protein YmL9 n=1 Tax=Boeremia exigua TaxID=749465 RepID=UPI001E8E8ED3|nr:mitochondrial 54S ribosomal protein YmL9 [Boeremia exigua]KAH6639502.1 mitochondrial 54S ribosomal protein YmL9 [Boeremia exigua]
MPPQVPLNWGSLPLLPSAIRSLVPLVQHNGATPALSYTSTRGIKSTFGPKKDRFAHRHGKPALNSTSTAALERKAHSTPLRTGLLALKRGMTALYDQETGRRTPCTVLQVDRNEVVALKTREKNGYWAVQIGAGQKEPRNVTRPLLGHFAQAGVSPKRHLAEFKVKDGSGLGLSVGESVGANWFAPGHWVDVRAISRGMGFAGGMKRHGFSGQPASHGNSLTHRAMGSAGGSQGSGSRVLPGKRMAGNMGNESVTVKNLKVLQVDEKNGLIVVTGCVPGPKNQIVKVQDALGKPWPKGPMNNAELAPIVEAAEPVEQATATA